MANLSALYTVTGTGNFKLNDGTFGHGSRDDLYWIDAIHGLDGPTLRVPSDDVPFGHGGLVHRSWKGPRHPVFDGRIIVQSAEASACEAILDSMEATMKTVLESILAPTAGTLTWPGHSLSVFYEVSVDFQPADNFRTRTFSFGLISPPADIT